MSLIPYAGFDPTEGRPRGWTGPKGPRVYCFDQDCIDLFDRGFDTAFIARYLHSTEGIVERTIWQERDRRIA